MNPAIDSIQRLIKGKSEAFVFGFYLQLVLLFILAWTKTETNWAGFAIALGAGNAAFYGGGVWKNYSKQKFSNGSSAPSSG